jgi:hypothetical protein
VGTDVVIAAPPVWHVSMPVCEKRAAKIVFACASIALIFVRHVLVLKRGADQWSPRSPPLVSQPVRSVQLNANVMVMTPRVKRVQQHVESVLPPAKSWLLKKIGTINCARA